MKAVTRWKRSKSGSGIIEGSAGFVLVTVVSIACGLMVSAIGAACYYKFKLGCVSDRSAEYLASLIYWSGSANPNFAGASLQLRAENLVNGLLANSGLPAASAVDASISGRLLTVSITVPGLRLINGTDALPISITLSDSAVAPIAVSQPPGVLGLNIPGSGTIYAPAYGKTGATNFYTWTGRKFQAEIGAPSGSTYSETP